MVLRENASRDSVSGRRVLERLYGHATGDAAWLAPGLAAGVLVYLTYLLTHPYPAFGAGLFSVMARQILEHGYALPATIPHYTADGVPFAYPPLMFYVVAALHDLTGVSYLAVSRVLPGLFTVASLVPLYFLARGILGSRRRAGVGTLVVAVSPPVLQWHISAGGIVRAPAAVFTLCGLYAGLRVFRDGDRAWVVPGVVCFGLTVLTHPVYSAFFVLTYLWLFAHYDRTLPGFGRGAVVGVGGLALAAPWVVQVALYHGLDVFTAAAGTHGGIGKQIPMLISIFNRSPGPVHRSGVLFVVSPNLFDFSTFGMFLLSVWSVALLAATAHFLTRSRYFLPVWGILAVLLISKPRFSFLVGGLMLGSALVDWAGAVDDRLGADAIDFPGGERSAGQVLVVLVLLAGVGVGVLYAGSQLDTHAGSTSLPAFIDDDDVAAMEWAERNTDPAADFVVIGDAAEWFPLYAERTILVGPWGVEWAGQAKYQQQLGLFNSISTCRSMVCIEAELAAAGTSPEYIYVPTEPYTVRGMEMTDYPTVADEFMRSERYELAYENEGVAVFRVVGRDWAGPMTPPSPPDRNGELVTTRFADPPRRVVEGR